MSLSAYGNKQPHKLLQFIAVMQLRYAMEITSVCKFKSIIAYSKYNPYEKQRH
jgi:hypothetical protein